MMYYIQWPGKKVDPMNGDGQLGEDSFKTFWPQTGYDILMKLVDLEKNDVIEASVVIDQKGKKTTVEEFLKMLLKKKIKPRQKY